MGSASRFSAEAKCEVLALVELTKQRTHCTTARILRSLGIAKSRYHAWARRLSEDALVDRCSRPVTELDALLTEEKEAVKQYALLHPKDGYRRLTWQMVDEDVAFMSASSVHRACIERASRAGRGRHAVSVAPA